MNLFKSGRTYLVSRAVEDPLEATFELGEQMSKWEWRLRFATDLGSIAAVISILILLPSLLLNFLDIIDSMLGNIAIGTDAARMLLVSTVIILIILAVSSTALIFLIQIRRFYGHIFQRQKTVSELKHAPVKSSHIAKSGIEPHRKHLSNPILAMLDLIEDASHQIHKLNKLLWLCRNFLLVDIVLFILIIASRLMIPDGLTIFGTTFELILGAAFVPILVISLFLIDDSLNFFVYYHSRHHIIDSIRFGSMPRVPSGSGPLQRLIKHLTETDPYIAAAVERNGAAFKLDAKMPISDGTEHLFDAVLEGTNASRKTKFGTIIPVGKFLVLVRGYSKPITLDAIKNYKNAAESVCGGRGALPLRVIAIQHRIGGLDDDVYEFVLENPIVIRGVMTHIQIASEDGEFYSFIPRIEYGREDV